MKKIVVYIVLLFSLFVGCVDHQSDDWFSSVIVRGAQIQCVGRAAEENTQFQAGDVVSFFSQGGIEAENVRLTYQDGIWEHGGVLKWNTSGKTASFAAFYPSFESDDWNYYDEDGFLKDIVYADGEVSSGMFIELSFRHLFSKITFKVDEKLNEQIQSIAFTPSVQVESIDPLTREVALTGTSANPLVIEKQPDRLYSFFVPSADEVTIDIQITTSDGKPLSSKTSSQSYESGYQYTYHLVPEERKPGIYTVEDFIAFTHLINEGSYSERSLEEFGETINGRTTYYLCDDLHFTEETSKKVQSIGMNSKKRFEDCFDGQGHTISGLQIGLGNTTYNGIFTYVQANGRIENLNVENCTYTNTTSNQTKFIGMIAVFNHGTIVGCNVKSCRIEDRKSGYAGGIVCNNLGYIFNCLVDNVQFIGDAMCSGGLCYGNEEDCEIVNCCVAQCHFIENAKSGGLCYNVAGGSNLLNCYVYSLDAGNSALGALLYQNRGGLIDYCYYQEDSNLKAMYSNSYNEGKIYTYDSDFTVTDKGCSLQEALNAWVEDNQEKYPDYPLWRWQAGDGNIPFVLQTP